MIAPGTAWEPGVGLALGAGAQVLAIELVETGRAQAQFGGRRSGGELAAAISRQEVADERSGQTLD
jgi:hypothetical protein